MRGSSGCVGRSRRLAKRGKPLITSYVEVSYEMAFRVPRKAAAPGLAERNGGAIRASLRVLIVAAVGLTTCSDRLAAAAGGAGSDIDGMSYAFVEDARLAHGIRATLIPLNRPHLKDGLSAAWVGVGGPNEGPGGTDEWIQVGLAAFWPSSANRVYFEVARPGRDPHYTELVSDTTVGARYDVAVLEIASRPGWWRVWLNRAPSSSPIHLPGSSGRWRPSATAETWNGGSPVCNSFAFRFERVEVAAAPGGSWKRLSAGARLQETGYRVDRDTDSTFSIFRTC